jgi:cbb3-type cytochrome oxidase subunit 3
MKVKMFLVLLLVVISVFGIVVTASNNNASNSTVLSEKQEAISESLINNSGQEPIDKPGTINGAKNPDLIPDRAAYSILDLLQK